MIDIKKEFKSRLDEIYNGINDGYDVPHYIPENPDILIIGANPAKDEHETREVPIFNESFFGCRFHDAINKHIRPLANSVGFWDFYQVRCTNFNTVKDIINSNIDFFNKQEKLSIDIINRVKPKMIVCLNAYVSRRLRTILNLSKEYGRVYRYNDIPVILSGAISGQGTIDEFSRDSLIEDIKIVLKNFSD